MKERQKDSEKIEIKPNKRGRKRKVKIIENKVKKKNEYLKKTE